MTLLQKLKKANYDVLDLPGHQGLRHTFYLARTHMGIRVGILDHQTEVSTALRPEDIEKIIAFLQKEQS